MNDKAFTYHARSHQGEVSFNAPTKKNININSVQVQHATKKSSDELLRKFAELEDDENTSGATRKELMVVVLVKRRKRNSLARRRELGGYSQCESPSGNGSNTSLVERKWLFLLATTWRSTLLRQLGIGSRN
ncbi:hypothetical protein CRYUN_Cryun08bG0105200 [Craigia yunnanensis]